MIKSFFAALSFISRLPVPARLSQGLEIEHYQRSIVTFPLVGLLLGAIAGAVALLLQPWCGVPLAALFGVLALALLTGGFHLDGLADTCDGIFSARTHGGLALIFVLVAKVLVIGELLLRDIHPIAALAAACAVGRGMAVLLMYRHRYAREKGLGNLFIGKISLQQTLVTMAMAIALATALLGLQGLRAALITLVLIWGLGWALKRTLGGQTGDTLGAAIELGELLFLLALL
ncbi:adenosylcobinamide-GDP ribazoletransferase [Klebsiella pneumoniae]|uniref:adenosylcobinamide-GDP ribazoletransferase n=1 Tax=Klebsiella pneumoniae TaxID=573 RepID=UPI001CBFBE7E|nr:adenosylcobinamide-GDP ribazoletransferase [Klebsiella pneumoniae]MBZ1554075.1 adenosylcobinamide-GDP ribazoletransferase [Klebsiella pneumoniae]